jgi:MFS family permease
VHNNGMSSSAPAAVAAAAPTHPVDPISGGGDETNTNNNTTRADLPSAFVMQVTAIASLGGILFGYDLGVISGALPQLTQAFDLTNSQKESVVSILYVGGGLGAALGGSICDSFGRKRAIMITDCIFLVGGLMLYAAPSYFFLLLGRVVVGFAVALSGCADVCYLHEIAPVQWRGAIVSVNEACISLGFLLAFGVAHVLTYEGNTSGWRLMFGLSGVLAIVQFVGMRTLPESPSWLQERGRHHEAEEAMRRINSDLSFSQLLWTEDETRELSASDRGNQTIYSTIPRDTSVAALASGEDESVLRISSPSIRPNAPGLWGAMPQFCRQTWLLLMQFGSFAKTTMANYRKQAYVALFLSVTQQLCGQTNVLSYAPLIFASLDADDDSSNYVRGGATLLIGVVKFLVTVIVIWKIEQTGRRLLLLIGMCIIAVGLFLLTIAFGAVDVSDAQDGELQDKANGLIYALPGVLLVVSGYSMSFGPLTWLLTSELFPTEIRGRALGASTIVTYGTAAVVTSTFLTAQEMFGPSAVFGFYLLVTLVGLVFAFTAISETKGKSEAEIEQDLDQMLWWRRHGSSQSLMGETGSEMIRTESNDGLL